MTTVDAAFLSDVTLAAGALGVLNLVARRFSGTPLLFPLALYCGSVAGLGLMGAFMHYAANVDQFELATQLYRGGLIASAFAIPAFAHLVVLYPREINHPAVRLALYLLYGLAIAYALLSPTALLVEGFTRSPDGIPIPTLGVVDAALSGPSYAFLLPAVAWLFYLARRGRTSSERRDARALLFAILPAAVMAFALVPAGYPVSDHDFPGVFTLSLGWATLFVGAALYSGWLRPPVPQGVQAILDASTDAVLVLDENGRVATANEAARVLRGTPALRLEGLPLKEALPPELCEASRAELLTMDAMGVLRGRIDRNTHEFKGGSPGERSFVVSVLPIGQGGGGGAHGALVMVRDETDRIALADATARLANLQDLVIRILGHDVKTPIAVIQGYAELAGMRLKGPLDAKGAEDVRRQMEHILEAVTTSQIILANARAISRLAAGTGTSAEFGALDISRMATQAAAVMQPLANSKGLTIGVDVRPNIFAKAPKGFESVFMNLLSNGVKYTPPGGSVEMTVRLEDGKAVVRVSDTGPGIDPDLRGRLFKRFERLNADQGKIEGQGLGLSIVASFVDLVGGSVRVEDRKDGRTGSVFVVEIRASQGNPGPAPTSSSQAGS